MKGLGRAQALQATIQPAQGRSFAAARPDLGGLAGQEAPDHQRGERAVAAWVSPEQHESPAVMVAMSRVHSTDA